MATATALFSVGLVAMGEAITAVVWLLGAAAILAAASASRLLWFAWAGVWTVVVLAPIVAMALFSSYRLERLMALVRGETDFAPLLLQTWFPPLDIGVAAVFVTALVAGCIALVWPRASAEGESSPLFQRQARGFIAGLGTTLVLLVMIHLASVAGWTHLGVAIDFLWSTH
ncbi:hypothetical protein [Halorhodospira halochloris]|uniref:hypothetical protein n=1 Tax=Halorhodospira halochloris TaxID=1052 RepID=UPI001EE8BDAD|nr:hypothetical protein [Halorhodospira halochloris]MCG5547978.1 hypothetical protein [Halorhodospira halochloris]